MPLIPYILATDFAVPYDNGFAVLVYNGSYAYIYFLNATTVKLVYSWSPYNVTASAPEVGQVPLAVPPVPELYVINGSLYAVLPQTNYGLPVVAFRGLTPVKLFFLQNSTFGSLGNLSAPEIIRVMPFVGIATPPVFPIPNTTVMLDGANFTVQGLTLTGSRLRQGDLIVSYTITYWFPPNCTTYHFYLYLLNGSTVLWEENFTLVPLGWPMVTLADDELFLLGKLPSSGQVEVIEVNVTDGKVIREIGLGDYSWASLFNLGGKPYVAIGDGNETVVYVMTDGSLVRALTMHISAEVNAFPWYYYKPYSYLLFFIPTRGGTNVTVVSNAGVTSYTIEGKVVDALDGELLVNESGTITLSITERCGLAYSKSALELAQART